MATTQELKARKKILENQIASLQKLDITQDTAQARLDAQKKIAPLREELKDINNRLSGKSKFKPDAPVVDANKVIDIASNAPAGISQDVAKDLLAEGFDVTSEAVFAAGGSGSTAFIWESDKPGTMGRQGYNFVPNIKLASTEITNFWNDEALQKKIMGSYAAKGKPITKLEAFSVWESLVTTAAKIYQGGRGAKVTPLQLLSDTLKGVGGEATLPQRTISQLDKDTTFKQIDNWSSNVLMTKLDDTQKESLFELLNTLNTGTVTEYKKTKNKKTGKLENVAVTTPGLTEAAAQRTIEDRLKELNPDDYDRAKRIEWQSWIMQNMGGV
jgi:hypothetical protein